MKTKIDVKRAVSDNKKVRFVKFFDGELWYKTEFNEEFSIPLSDTKGATFLFEDRAILFMRWMNKHNRDMGF